MLQLDGNTLASPKGLLERAAVSILPWKACGIPLSLRCIERAEAASRSLWVSCMVKEGEVR